MLIKVKRNTGWQGSGSNLNIYANGEKIGTVFHKKEVEVEIPHKQVQLKVMQFGVRSNRVTVKDGDQVEVTSTLWTRWSLPVLIILYSSLILLPGIQEKFMILLLLAIPLITLLLLFVKGYDLKVLPAEENS